MASTRRLVLASLATLVMGGVLSCGWVKGADEKDLKDSILRAWKDRQNRTKTVTFEWSQKNRMRLATLLSGVKEHIRKHVPNVGEFVTVEQPSSLRLDGERLDYRLDTLDSAKYSMPAGLRAAFDGVNSRYYTGTSSPDRQGSGVIQKAPHAFGTQLLYLKPLLLHYRPLHRTLTQIDLGQHRAHADRVPLGEHSCLVLEEVSDQPLRRRYWLDPDQDFVVRRFEEMVYEKQAQRIDISYTLDKQHGLVPSEWTTVTFTTGTDRLNSSAKCVVQRYVINEPIPLSEFQIEFPAGTHVDDQVKGRTYWMAEGLNSATASSASSSRFLLGISILLLIGLLVFMLVQRLRTHPLR